MANTSPSPGFLKRFLGSKDEAKDIELPSEKKKKKSKLDTISEGYGIFKGLGKSDK